MGQFWWGNSDGAVLMKQYLRSINRAWALLGNSGCKHKMLRHSKCMWLHLLDLIMLVDSSHSFYTTETSNIPKRADCSRLVFYYFVECFAEWSTKWRFCGEIGPIGMNGEMFKTRVGSDKSWQPHDQPKHYDHPMISQNNMTAPWKKIIKKKKNIFEKKNSFLKKKK